MRNILIALILVPTLGIGQSETSLDSVVAWAVTNFSFEQERTYVQKSQQLMDLNIQTAKLPQFMVTGSATWQNEQLEIALPGGFGPEVPLNFNRLLLNFNQTLYDGQLVARRARINELDYATQQTEIDIEILKLKAQVASIYFGALVAEERLDVLSEHREILMKKKEQLVAAHTNGLVLPSALNILDAEIIGVDQKVVELNSVAVSMRAMLTSLTGQNLQTTELEIPEFSGAQTKELNRPELSIMDTRIEMLNAQKNLTSAMRQPNISLFGNAGLGDPGFNILDESVRPMLFVGLKVDWMPWDWRRNQNSISIIEQSQARIRTTKQRAETQFLTSLGKQAEEINKYNKLIEYDTRLEALRKTVAEELSVQVLNGAATASDYSVALTHSSAAKMNKALHQLQKLLAQLNYQIIQGEF